VGTSGAIYTKGNILTDGGVTAKDVAASGNITAGGSMSAVKVTASGDMSAGGNITASGNIGTTNGSMSAVNMTASNTMKASYIEVSSKATFAGGTYVNSNGGMVFANYKSWIGFNGDAGFAGDNVKIGVNGEFYLKTLSSGAIGVNASGQVVNHSSSSKRYKENITEDYDEKLNPENLYKIPVKQFNYKNEYKDITPYSDTQVGLIAEDVDKYFPSACCYDNQGQVEGWHDRLIVPAMLKLIQNQKLSIDSLCQKCKDLSEELDIIKSKISE